MVIVCIDLICRLCQKFSESGGARGLAGGPGASRSIFGQAVCFYSSAKINMDLICFSGKCILA